MTKKEKLWKMKEKQQNPHKKLKNLMNIYNSKSQLFILGTWTETTSSAWSWVFSFGTPTIPHLKLPILFLLEPQNLV